MERPYEHPTTTPYQFDLSVVEETQDLGQVTELWLSCYLGLLSIDSKTRQLKTDAVPWPDPPTISLMY